VEIGAIDNTGVQLDASYGLLLNLLPRLPRDAERRPSQQRKAGRLSRTEVCRKEWRGAATESCWEGLPGEDDGV